MKKTNKKRKTVSTFTIDYSLDLSDLNAKLAAFHAAREAFERAIAALGTAEIKITQASAE